MSAGELDIDIDRAGRGTMILGGYDISNYVHAFEIQMVAGHSPDVTIHLNPVRLNLKGDPEALKFIQHELDKQEETS